ncbi:hypothetical protein HMPREF1624_02602 [Sporothrix schenckii ATCC 58251]|uniref:Multicopper oxidase n=1 Tax=Sporothrix schenckii (strain ATCC 58251 / de Perez 2211183) TaxID=1391915 RepID=U7Q2E0_SPOS1|nr:hypothetical protein HMPREF1624_02602 [Sporothrix schenckii ATCC 58251]
MPDDTSEQGDRLLRPPLDHVHKWKAGEDGPGAQETGSDSDEEQAQWPPASRRPPSRWQRLCRALATVRQIVMPVLAILTALAVVMALFLLLTGGSLSMPAYDTDTDAPKARPTAKDPVIVLHPEDHTNREPQTIRLSWNITKSRIAPDGVFRDVILINGEFPGPTIEARTGDTLVVTVTNSLVDEGLSLHWHGLHMRGANHMDGPVGVTQCAIPANGGSFVYEVPTGDQAGTFWYHSHSEMQRADGLYGGLVVHAPTDTPATAAAAAAAAVDKEILLLVGDWYQFSGKTVFAEFQDPTSNGNEPVPGSVLINGRGAFDCGRATKAAPVDCHAVELPPLRLDTRLRYRVRLVNVGVLTGISTTVPDARIDVLTVDGGLPVVVPDDAKAVAANSIGVVYPAQRVDYVLSWPDAGATGDGTQLVVTVDGEYYVGNWQDPPSQTFAIVAAPSTQRRATRPVQRAASPPPSTQATQPTRAIDLRTVHGTALSTPLPAPDKLYMIFAVVEILSHNKFIPKGYINHTMWVPQERPLLSLDRSAWDSHQLVPWTGAAPVWVELTINNIDTQGHPFHLHGFDFYVVGSHEGLGGWDYYNPFFVPWKPPRGGPMNTLDPVLRDTVYVPPYGYVILRFRADNEGIWVLHCHILWHQASGMNMAFQVLGHSEHGLGGTPQSFRAAEYCRTRNEKHPHL